MVKESDGKSPEGIVNLLYVCYANIIRSFAAEQITRQLIDEWKINGLSVSSAGLNTVVDEWDVRRFSGKQLDTDGLRDVGVKNELSVALSQIGVSYPQRYTLQQVTEGLLKKQDIILCFEVPQIEEIRKQMPETRNEAYFTPFTPRRQIVDTLSGFAGFQRAEVPDPDCLVSELPAYRILRLTPYPFRRAAYKRIGYVDNRDQKAIIGLFTDTFREIQKYVTLTLERMISEGSIVAETPPKPKTAATYL